MMLSRGLRLALRMAYGVADLRGHRLVRVEDVLRNVAAVNPEAASAIPPDGRHDRLSISVPIAPEPEVIGPLREVRWNQTGLTGRRLRPRRKLVPHWDLEVVELLKRARRTAIEEGAPYVGSRHALQVLGLGGDLDAGSWAETERQGYGTAAEFLAGRQILVPSGSDPPMPVRVRLLERTIRVMGQTGWVLYTLELDVITHAVQLDHPMVTPDHLMLALVDLEERVRTAGLTFRRQYAEANRPALAGYSRYDGVRSIAPPAPDEQLSERRRRRAWRSDPDSPPWSLRAADAADRARELAAAERTVAGTRHLLQALREVSG